MPSRRPASEKRARLPRRSNFTSQFEKDWTRLAASGRYDLNRAKQGMRLIVDNDGPLPPEWRDHSLSGQWAHHREFHVGGDFLVIYQPRDDDGVVFTRIGTHSELFK